MAINKAASKVGIFFLILAVLALSPFLAAADVVINQNTLDLTNTTAGNFTLNNTNTTDARSVTYTISNLQDLDGNILSFALNPLSPQVLAPNETKNISLSASFSALLFLHGRYNATLNSTDNATPAMTDQLNVSVNIPLVTCNSVDVDIRDIDVPSRVERGRSEQITVTVSNERSSSASIKTRVWLFDNTEGRTVAFDETTDRIRGDNDDEIDVDLNVPSDLIDTHSFTIFAQAIDESNRCDISSQTADVVDDGGGSGDDDRLCDGEGLNGDIRITDVECDGDDCDDADLESDDEFDVDIEFENRGNNDLDDVVVQAWICEDDEFCDIDDRDAIVDDEEDVGNLDSDDDDTSSLTLDLNDADIDEDNDYFLHVRVFDDDEGIDDQCDEKVFELDIEEQEDDITIDDVEFENLVCGDRARIIVTVENNGKRDQNDVRAFVSTAEGFIVDESEEFDLDSDERRFVLLEPIIPIDIAPGPYRFDIRVRSDDDSDSESITQAILCAGYVAPVVPGEGVIIPRKEEEEGPGPSRQERVANVLTPRQVRVGVPTRVSVSSQLDSDQEFTFSVSGADANVEPSRALLSPQIPFDVFVMVDPNEDTEGLVLTLRAQGGTQNEQFSVVGGKTEEKPALIREDTTGGVVVSPQVEEEPRPRIIEGARRWIVPAAIGIGAAIIIVVIIALLL